MLSKVQTNKSHSKGSHHIFAVLVGLFSSIASGIAYCLTRAGARAADQPVLSDKWNFFKLWVLKDYGIKESWNALLTIEDPLIQRVIPKYRFADGEVLFWCYHVQSRGDAFRNIQ